LKLNLVDKILFPSGSAKLTDKGKEVLDKVGFALKDINDRRIMIEGHTDDVPLSPSLQKRYGSNWGLSAMRATAVVRYLQEHGGIDPRLLAATGYSMYRPYRENDTIEGRQANRRIEIILTPLSPQEMQDLYASPTQAETPPSIPPAPPESR
jgi:chemotaxis protein MotB